MNISGIYTKVERVNVDVEPNDLIEAVTKLIDEVYQHKCGEFIHNGYWQVYDHFDYHRNEQCYQQGKLATDEEIFVEKVKSFLNDLSIKLAQRGKA